MIDKKQFMHEIETHTYRQGIYIFPTKSSTKKKHSSITVYFIMKQKNSAVLTKLKYRRKQDFTVTTWKKWITQKDKIPHAFDLFLSGYNEKYDTNFKFKRIFAIKFS